MDNRPKLIVLPLQPKQDQAYNGLGLGIHFLLGNMVAVHPKLAECWFGWRVNKIFKTIMDLKGFCTGCKGLDLALLAKEQSIRFWLSGQYRQIRENVRVCLHLYDADLDKTLDFDLDLDPSDLFIDFTQRFINNLALFNLRMAQKNVANALWKEEISVQGLEYLGYAVEATYQNYIDPSLLTDGCFDLKWFEKAVMQSPLSYLANNLKGWAFYKNKAYEKAKSSFKTALEKNPSGMGAISGMILCYVVEKNKTKALEFSIAKADIKNESHDTAIRFIGKKF